MYLCVSSIWSNVIRSAYFQRIDNGVPIDYLAEAVSAWCIVTPVFIVIFIYTE